jgi:cytidylate kinase
MAAVTISRELGSLGTLIAEEVGRRLGFSVVQREVINRAAQKAGVPEMALAVIDDLGLLGVRPSRQAQRAYLDAIAHVMHELAEQGSVVIVGRAGQVILAGRPDVLHVRICAPISVRAERIARRHGISLEQARAQVEASDAARRAYLRRYYHVRWDDPYLYHLIINTAGLSVPAAAELICLALKERLSSTGAVLPT